MDLGIGNRTAVVAASSRGIGRAVAEALAAEGAKLALCSRDGDSVRKAADEIRQAHGAEVFAAPVDVTDEAAVAGFVGQARENLGPVSILVANCGGPPTGTFKDFETEDWKRAFDTSFLSTYYLIRNCLPDMVDQQWGRVVSITSMSVKQPIDGLILSNAIRGAVIGLMKSLSNEYGPEGVLFNNVGPGMTATDRLLNNSAKQAEAQGITRDELIARKASEAPLRRVGEPAELADVVAFFCSERASYVTGENVIVDGGLTKGI